MGVIHSTDAAKQRRPAESNPPPTTFRSWGKKSANCETNCSWGIIKEPTEVE